MAGSTVRAAGATGRPFVEVADTGIGIAADEQDRLFERFFRTSAATERVHPGHRPRPLDRAAIAAATVGK